MPLKARLKRWAWALQMRISRMRVRNKGFEMDMLNGPVMPKLLSFAFPLMLSSILQLAFNAADVIVVGRFEGDAALAAVGTPSPLINLLVNLFIGLSVGANVIVAQCYGAGDYRQTQDAVHTSVALSIFSGLFIGVIGFFAAGGLLRMIDADPEFLPMATIYMKIYFLGMPANMIYNFGAAVLRAVGDTRRPLLYLFISGVVNVLLNLLFVIVFHMGVSGVALATIISQMVSATLVVLCLIHTDGPIHLNVKKIRMDMKKVAQIARVGLPAGLQGILFSISNVMIQKSVNGFGTVVTAGNTTSGNLEGFIYVSMNAIYQAAITFTGQNVGANKPARINRIARDALIAVTGIGLAAGALLMVFRHQLFGIYTSDPAVQEAAAVRSSIIAPTYFLCGLMDTMVGLLRGMGTSMVPMVVSVVGVCGFRIVWILFVFPLNPTLGMLILSYPISWGMTFLIHFGCFLWVKRRKFGIPTFAITD